MKKFLSMTIEQGQGATYRTSKWNVYGHSIYEHGVLEGQDCRSFVAGGFDTLEEAKAKYPDAEIIEGTTYTSIEQATAHLPDDDGSSDEADDYRNE